MNDSRRAPLCSTEQWKALGRDAAFYNFLWEYFPYIDATDPIAAINNFRHPESQKDGLNPNISPEKLPLSLQLLETMFNNSSLSDEIYYDRGMLYERFPRENNQRFSPQFLTDYKQLRRIMFAIVVEPHKLSPSWSYRKIKKSDSNILPECLLTEFIKFSELAYSAGNLISIPFHFCIGENQNFGVRNLPAARKYCLFIGDIKLNLNGQGALFIEWLKQAQEPTRRKSSLPISYKEWSEWMCITDEIASLYNLAYEAYKEIFLPYTAQEKHIIFAKYINLVNSAIIRRGELIFGKIGGQQNVE